MKYLGIRPILMGFILSLTIAVSQTDPADWVVDPDCHRSD